MSPPARWIRRPASRSGTCCSTSTGPARRMVLVTHNPDLAARYASRTVQLVDGRVVADVSAGAAGAGAAEPVRHEDRSRWAGQYEAAWPGAGCRPS